MDRHTRSLRNQISRLLRRNEKLETQLKASRAAYRELIQAKLETMTTPEQAFEALRASWRKDGGR